MGYLTMLVEAFAFRDVQEKDLQAHMPIGSISTLMEILAMVMDSGMKDGKVIMNL